MKAQESHSQGNTLPAGLAQPAQRALAAIGIKHLEQLANYSEAKIRELHGIGPNAIAKLREALFAKGLSFTDKK